MHELIDNFPSFRKLELLGLQFSSTEGVVCLENLLSKVPSTLKSIGFRAINSELCNNNSSNIQPLSSVRKVVIAITGKTFIREEDYLYIMNKFPQVEILDIKFRKLSESPTLHDLTIPKVESLCQFLVYLFHIRRSYSVPPLITNESTGEVVKSFLEYVLSQRTSSATFRNLKIHLQVDFKVITPPGGRDNSQHCGAFITTKNERCGQKQICKVEVVYQIIFESTYQPYLDLFQKIGGMDIECLSIGADSLKDSMEKEVPIPLDTIFDNFTNLTKLIISESGGITCHKVLSNLEEEPKSNLESLEFHGCELTQEVFTYISAKCANLKVLKINICQFKKPWKLGEFPDLIRHVRIHMPFTTLLELHFTISLDTHFEEFPYRKAIIRCETPADETIYYKINLEGGYDNDGSDRDSYDSDLEAEFHHILRSQPYSKVDFEECLQDNGCLAYTISCEAVTKLFVYVKDVTNPYLEDITF